MFAKYQGFVLIAAVSLIPAQASNLIQNAAFTTGSPSLSGSQAGYWALPVSGGYVPTGWNVSTSLNGNGTLTCVIENNSASLVTSSNGNVCGNAEGQNWGFNYSVPNAPGGGYYFASDASNSYNGPLYQTVSALTVGQQYILSFYAAADQQYGFTQSITAYWGVDVYGGSAAPPTSPSSYADPMGTAGLSPSNTQSWVLVTETFVATATTETIAFLAGSQQGGSGGPPFALLADVNLSATPEPGTMALLGLGLLSIPALRSFAKKRR